MHNIIGSKSIISTKEKRKVQGTDCEVHLAKESKIWECILHLVNTDSNNTMNILYVNEINI